MKKLFIRNKSIFWIFSLWFVVSLTFLLTGFLNVDFSRETHINILTINSIIAGFLFTSLGIMVGFMHNNKIENLDKNGYMDKYYNSIYVGLGFHVISITLAMLGVVSSASLNINFLLILEQVTLLGGVFFFINSIYSIQRIINRLRNN